MADTSYTEAIRTETYSVTTAEAIGIDTVSLTGRVATKARITILGDGIRYRYDGVDPEPNKGHYIGVGFEREFIGPTNLQQFRAIATTGTATLTVTLEAPSE